MYRPQWVNDIIAKRSVTDLALSVHGACCGSGEWYEGFWRDVKAMSWIVSHWTPGGSFDTAVQLVLGCAVLEALGSHWGERDKITSLEDLAAVPDGSMKEKTCGSADNRASAGISSASPHGPPNSSSSATCS